MKTITLAAMLLAASGLCHAAKPCEELKKEIGAKLEANHASGYTLDIVANDKVGDAKVLGSCELGSKKVVMQKQKK